MRVGGRAHVDLDARPQPIDVRSQQPAGSELTRRGGQRPSPHRLPRAPGVASGLEQARRAHLLVDREGRGSLERGGGRDVPTTLLGADSRLVQIVGDGPVWPVRRGGTMPRRPVRVTAAQCVRQGPVRAAALDAAGRLVDRRTDQGVAYGHTGTGDGEQAGPLGLRPGGRRNATPGRGLPHDVDPAGVVGRGHQQQRLPLLAQPAATVEEGTLHTGRQRQLLRQRR
jgi:hypothetical protein